MVELRDSGASRNSPAEDHVALAEVLMRRLGGVFAACAADSASYPNVHFFDSTQVPLVKARPGTKGRDGDWINEIHLTRRGYEKIARPWAARIERMIRLQQRDAG